MTKPTSLRPIVLEVRTRIWCPKHQAKVSLEECRPCKDHLGQLYGYQRRPESAPGDYVECDYVEIIDLT